MPTDKRTSRRNKQKDPHPHSEEEASEWWPQRKHAQQNTRSAKDDNALNLLDMFWCNGSFGEIDRVIGRDESRQASLGRGTEQDRLQVYNHVPQLLTRR